MLVVGYWLLVIGYWLLVVGCWLLVVGCWYLVDWYCLPDSSPILVFSPETSSRVTLAALGIGFQPNLAGHLAYEDE